MCKQAPSHHLTHTGFWSPRGRSDAHLGSTMQPPPGDENSEGARRHKAHQWLSLEEETHPNRGGGGGWMGGGAGAAPRFCDLEMLNVSAVVSLLELWCFKEPDSGEKERIRSLLMFLMFVLVPHVRRVWGIVRGRVKDYSWCFTWFFSGSFCHRPWTLI